MIDIIATILFGALTVFIIIMMCLLVYIIFKTLKNI